MDLPTLESAPAIVPVTKVAALLGIDHRTLLDDLETGRAPLRLRRFGKARRAYVVVEDVRRFYPELMAMPLI